MNLEGIPNESAYKLAQLILSAELGIPKELIGSKKKRAIAAPLQIFFKMVFTSCSPGS